MRILLVGNYDIAGQYLATRLYKESHKISWLTQETEKKLWEAPVHGNVYRYKITYANCVHICRTESFDCVIFLNQSGVEAYQWDDSMLMGMTDTCFEVLKAAAQTGTKKIIYMSSKELASDKILNPAFEKLRCEEILCQSVCEEKKMQCLIVRTGIVYGKSLYPDAGFLSSLFWKASDKGRLNISYTKDSTFDFIYGSDLADAVERLIAMNASGVQNVLTGYPVSLQEVVSAIEYNKGTACSVRYGSIMHYENPEDALAFKEYTGWMPFYIFKDTVKDVLSETVYSQSVEKKHKPKKHIKIAQNTFLRQLVQNLLLFALLTCVNVFSSDWSDIRFVDVKLLYVVIVSISFGIRQGIIAVILASTAYIVKLSMSDVDLSYIAYSIDTWIPFIVYGLAGAVVGYVTDKKNDEMDTEIEEHQNLKEKYDFLKSMYQEVLQIKNQLQKQIMISKDSLSRIYDITEELNDLKPRTVLFHAVKMIEETMECSGVAIYVISDSNPQYGRLMACSEDVIRELKGSIRLSEYEKMKESMLKNSVFVNTDFLEEYPGFAKPVYDNDSIIAIVCIYHVEPDRYTIYYKNLFKTLIMILQSCLVRAYRYEEENMGKLCIEGTDILVPDQFRAELASINSAYEELKYPFSYGKVIYPDKMSFNECAKLVESLVRSTDIVGCDEYDNIYVILLFVNESARSYTEKRFSNSGLSLQWEN